MANKTIRYEPPPTAPTQGRRFEIHIVSEPAGYSAHVEELLSGGGRQRVELPYGPRIEIHPTSFFSMRTHYRGEFAADLKAALRYTVCIGQSEPADEDPPTFFLRAYKVGWEAGYPGSKLDDMADWVEL